MCSEVIVRRHMPSFVLRSLAAVATFALATSTLAQQPYQVVDHWKVGGIGGWDYLLADPSAHLLYLTHNARVEVIDTQTGKTVGAITGLTGTHGVALDPEGKFGYISDGGANAVIVFDRKTFATLASIPAGTNPDGIAYEPITKTVWAFNGRSKNATVIDTGSRTVVATIALPGKPEFPQADGKGHVFDNIEDKNSIVRLDAVSKTLTDTFPVAGCDSPSGLAMDREHSRLFAVCDGKKMGVLDANTGKELALVNIGDGPDAAGYDSRHQLAFSSNGEGTLTIVDAKDGYKPVETLATQKGARTMAYDSVTDRIYLVTAEYGALPGPSAANPRPRPTVVPDTFTVLIVARK
jgi:DNA-binding beta-propeller fold protein YncE